MRTTSCSNEHVTKFIPMKTNEQVFKIVGRANRSISRVFLASFLLAIVKGSYGFSGKLMKMKFMTICSELIVISMIKTG